MPAVEHWKPRTRLREVVKEDEREFREWPEIRSLLMRVLEAFPDAKEAFLAALREEDITDDTKVVRAEWEKDLKWGT